MSYFCLSTVPSRNQSIFFVYGFTNFVYFIYIGDILHIWNIIGDILGLNFFIQYAFFFFEVLPYCSISTSLLFFDWIIIINYPILCTQVCTVIGLLNNSLMDFFLFSHSLVYNSLRHHVLQHSRLPCPSPSPGACSISCSLSCWFHSRSHPLWSPSPPAFNLSQHQDLFQLVSSLHQVAKVLDFQLQHQSF